jgi:hypothetical protein
MDAAITGDPVSKEKFASRATDLVLNTADLVTLVDGVGAAKSAAVSGGKALAQGGKALKATIKGAAEAINDGRLVPAMGVMDAGGGALAATGPFKIPNVTLMQGAKATVLMSQAKNIQGGSSRPPELDVAEVKPAGKASKGWQQMKQPQYTTEIVIGPAAKGGGRAGVATYSRETGEVILQVKEITGPGKFGKTLSSQKIGTLSQQELAQLSAASGGDTSKFGVLVEPKIRDMIGKATGQTPFNPGKAGSAHGPDFVPQQLPLPHIR